MNPPFDVPQPGGEEKIQLQAAGKYLPGKETGAGAVGCPLPHQRRKIPESG